ncbi:MAG TPA: SUF system Fe-S cluster assembly protein [Thermoanaerobaculia bacterium]|jgi:FeS assembly SUF system protein|nr:SUF system Fe-S cluster assembly protein [Thermoanaerobaculia bacterium]
MIESLETPLIPTESAPSDALSAKSEAALENAVVEVLQTVYDPEIPVNIYELGLIYDLDVQATGRVHIQMTLTAPACPVAGTLPGEIRAKVAGVPGVTEAEVELVWEPAWDPSRMSEAARLQLGMF